MVISPIILGSGRSSDVINKTLRMLAASSKVLEIAPPIILKRGSSLSQIKSFQNPIVCIAHPHALHADAILEAENHGAKGILCEKPVCVNLEQVRLLRNVKTPTAVLHGYRQTWGIQKIKEMIDQGELGEIITIEGRYWQSSAAERALSTEREKLGWKDDPSLSGDYDTYLDIATHWTDAASFLMGEIPKNVRGWRSYINSDQAHRDSHVQLNLTFSKAQSIASISKTTHGFNNHFEIHIIGSKKSASWEFLRPDEIRIGSGRDYQVISRKTNIHGTGLPAHHGMGWTEGYYEITKNLLGHAFHNQQVQYPTLKESLDLMEVMLKVQWA